MFEKEPLEDWIKHQKERRSAVIAKQDEALKNTCLSGTNLAKYLEGRGRLGSQLSSGNAALVLSQLPMARLVMSSEEWKLVNRKINRGAMGVDVLVKKGHYFTAAKYFDVSQTYGGTPIGQRDLSNDSPKAMKAVDEMLKLSHVQVVPSSGPMAATYNLDRNAICINEKASPQDVLRYLPLALIASYIYEQNPDSKLSEVSFYAMSVSTEVCGRLGLSPIEHAAESLDGLVQEVSKGKEREVLNNIRSFARAIGDNVELALPDLNRSAPARAQAPER